MIQFGGRKYKTEDIIGPSPFSTKPRIKLDYLHPQYKPQEKQKEMLTEKRRKILSYSPIEKGAVLNKTVLNEDAEKLKSQDMPQKVPSKVSLRKSRERMYLIPNLIHTDSYDILNDGSKVQNSASKQEKPDSVVREPLQRAKVFRPLKLFKKRAVFDHSQSFMSIETHRQW